MDEQINAPTRHHYIPRSYLKNFAKLVKTRAAVDVYDFTSNQVRINQSTKDVCLKSNLYALPGSGKERYRLEEYYANNVDTAYPEVYELLVNPKKTDISNKQRYKILYTLLSLYFRTPRLWNMHNQMTDQIFDKMVALQMGKEEIVFNLEGRTIRFKSAEVQAAKRNEHVLNRHRFLATHFQEWHDFVKYKYTCGLMVTKLDSEFDLITSDSPVIINSPKSTRFNLYNPLNSIQVPLDRKHYLYVAPGAENILPNKIFRTFGDDMFVLSTNYQIHKSAERLLVGYPGTIQKHLDDQKKYGEENQENEKRVDDFKTKLKLTQELYNLMESSGGLNQQVFNKIEEMKSTELFRNDMELLHIEEELLKKRNG